jgi:hypothetical protein
LALVEQGYDVLPISPPGPYGGKLQALGPRWELVPMDRTSLKFAANVCQKPTESRLTPDACFWGIRLEC